VTIVVHPEVADALAARRPIVALESTIFSPFGLPAPANVDALARCTRAVRESGAVPAVTAVLDGTARVGLDEREHERILYGGRKIAERDLPVALAQREEVGVTTVSASLALAARTGIDVFATGGIGGVHRGADRTDDVSADLGAIASHSVITVSAGAKAFLDLPRTLERLETLAVPVLGWQTDEFPMFWSRTSGLALTHRVDEPAQAAAVLRAARELGAPQGVLVAVPIPVDAAIPREEIEAAIAAVDHSAVAGAAVTPVVLAEIAAATEGRSVPANLVLAEHNASVAAAIAGALAVRTRGEFG
jgi:pseudouridine-5'-phosphate glycosidase